MLVVWATAKAPGKLPKMWPSSKHSKLNYIPLKNSLGLVRHTQAFYVGNLSFMLKMEIMISPRCVGTRKALSIWNKMKTIYLVVLSNNTLLNSKWNQNVYFWFWPYMLKIMVYSCPGSCLEEFSLWVRDSKRKELAILSTLWQTKNKITKHPKGLGDLLQINT